MRFRLLLLVLLVFPCAAGSARAQVFVGPNLEWSHFSFPEAFRDESGNVVSIGGFYLQPGLRLGYLFPGGILAASVDAGVQSEHLGSFKYTSVIVEPTLAYLFRADHATSPYAGVSTGLEHLSSLEHFTRPIVGGAVGVRRRVSAGHGFVRGELRYDHFMKRDTKGFVVPENTVGLRIGLDLVLSR